ncbi:ABC transporter substrate-binding protein [Algoriphagus mannitolivorans]|uniref:ABC transporter substrate-binding protein n=1 Tax=Algoriphagus mannitolivorans TaxID=226504 RepID=UPI0003F5DD4A|nr:helical backbone metal receptor [Algoriphagus mannitolivorans]
MKFTDQLDRTILLPRSPQRIISLVPSQTELLVDLGLEERIVGVTKFCVHPSHLKKTKTIVGGTKNYRMEVIDSLKPDLILGNKEENDQKGIEELAKKYPVWMSDIYHLEDALEMIQRVGEITGTTESAIHICQRIKDSFFSKIPSRGSCIYLIWNNPMMAAGKNTFIDDLIRRAGFENLVTKNRYPELDLEEIQNSKPDYILLSSEPYPFKEKEVKSFQAIFPHSKILLVDGEMFSWYGSRLLKSASYFLDLDQAF